MVALMAAEGPFGPQGKRVEKPTHEEEVDRFTRAFGFQPEEKYEPEEIPPERDLAVSEKSMWGQYFSRHPEAKPKPKPLLKTMGPAISPDGTTAGSIAQRLLDQLKTLVENHARLSEKIANLESKVDPNPCADKGPNYRMISGECIEVKPGVLDPPAAPTPPPQGMSKDSKIVDGTMSKTVKKGKFFRKEISLKSGWKILSGASDGAN